MGKKNSEEKKLFTKKEIKIIIELWETKTTSQIAEILNRKNGSVGYMAGQIRKAGYALPRKQKKNTQQFLVKELLYEMKLIKKPTN